MRSGMSVADRIAYQHHIFISRDLIRCQPRNQDQRLFAVHTHCAPVCENVISRRPADSSIAIIRPRVNRFSSRVPKRSRASVRMT